MHLTECGLPDLWVFQHFLHAPGKSRCGALFRVFEVVPLIPFENTIDSGLPEEFQLGPDADPHRRHDGVFRPLLPVAQAQIYNFRLNRVCLDVVDPAGEPYRRRGCRNAGKSSLLNALTGADAFVENKLFATLDPLTRKLNLKDGNGILLTDTVGFISNLPHSLIDAFKSTLAEAKNANLQLIVIDAGDEQHEAEFNTVIQVLKEIDADQNERLIILNKWDTIEGNEPAKARLAVLFPDAVRVSAKTRFGFDQLFDRISEALLGTEEAFVIPLAEAALIQRIRCDGVITTEDWQENSVRITARISGKTAALARAYKERT